jgi:hypothetical protein
VLEKRGVILCVDDEADALALRKLVLQSRGYSVKVSVLIHEHAAMIKNNNATYIVRIYASERSDHTWEGWLEFHPTDKSKSMLRTGQETSQPSRDTIEYWALGLEPVYLEGALARASGRLL